MRCLASHQLGLNLLMVTPQSVTSVLATVQGGRRVVRRLIKIVDWGNGRSRHEDEEDDKSGG